MFDFRRMFSGVSFEMRPLIVDPSTIMPLPEAMWGSNCSVCDRRQSRWEHVLDTSRRSGVRPICSLCWLYGSKWAEDNEEQLRVFVRAVHAARGGRLELDEKGRMTSIEQADRVMGSLVFTSRLFISADGRRL
jgi:hypothetical protein